MIVQLHEQSQLLPQSAHCFHLFQHEQVVYLQPRDISITVFSYFPQKFCVYIEAVLFADEIPVQNKEYLLPRHLWALH